MKVFEAIDAKIAREVPVKSRFVIMEPEYIVMPTERLNYFQWNVGIQLKCRFTGPREGRDHYIAQAKRMIAQELYDEVEGDLMELWRVLNEEDYRPDGDKAMGIIKDLLQKIRGE